MVYSIKFKLKVLSLEHTLKNSVQFSSVTQSWLTLCDPCGLWPARLLCPWDFPGQNTGVGCHFLLQRIFLAQGSNPGLPHSRQTIYHLSYQGRPVSFPLTIDVYQIMFCTLKVKVKVVQSCLTLCNPIDSSPPGSPTPGILQARMLEWVAISFSNA